MTEKRLELVRGLGAWASAAIVCRHDDWHRHFPEARGNGARGTQRLRRIRGVDCGRDSFDFLRFFRSRNWDR